MCVQRCDGPGAAGPSTSEDIVRATPGTTARRNTTGVPEWNETEINTVLDLWIQNNRLPQWKPIANKLNELNRHGALNPELAAKGLERTNNAVMNKVKELSGMSRARRSRPRTLGNFAALEQDALGKAAGGGGGDTGAMSSLIAAANMDSRAATTGLHDAVAAARSEVLAAEQAQTVPLVPPPAPPAEPEAAVPPPPAPAEMAMPIAAVYGRPADVPPPMLVPRRQLTHAVRGVVPAVSPVAHETPVIAQVKVVEPSYADGTAPAVGVVGPVAPSPVSPVVQNDY